jgi:hypothetical protein
MGSWGKISPLHAWSAMQRVSANGQDFRHANGFPMMDENPQRAIAKHVYCSFVFPSESPSCLPCCEQVPRWLSHVLRYSHPTLTNSEAVSRAHMLDISAIHNPIPKRVGFTRKAVT